MKTALILLTAAAALQAAPVRPTRLRCEYRTNPLGIDETAPRLSWRLTASGVTRGITQSAYRVLAASSREALGRDSGDLWDSGKVESSESAHVVYAGKPVTSGRQVYWKVMVWDNSGSPSTWSEAAFFTMGLLQASDWKARWIGKEEPAGYVDPASVFHNLRDAHWIWAADKAAEKAVLQADVTVPAGRKVRKAIVVMASDHRYELFLNGESVIRGTNPAMPDLLDITSELKTGLNQLEVRATRRNANRPAGVIGAIGIEFVEGQPLVFHTGAEWKSDGAAPATLGAYGADPWGEVGFAEERALPARMVRKEFNLRGPVSRATAYVSGLGLFELYLNGAKVGDHVLSPGLTDYDKRVLYVTYDVTRLLKPGANAAGLMLGNGRYWAPRAKVPIAMRTYGFPRALCQIEVEYAGGGAETIATGPSWKVTADGPVRANNEYDGEDYDARREMPNWSRPGFADSGWTPVEMVSAPKGSLRAQMAEPIRVTQTLRPVKLTEPHPGVYVFDMGQNMVGWTRLKVSGPRGTEVSLRHAETLQPNGMLYLDNLRSARALNHYVLKGGAVELWEPRFTYHGFRYVEVRGYPGKPTLDAIEGRVVHDAMAKAGEFTSSNSLLNQIDKNIYWGMRGNYRSIPTDCPQRDERQGWLGDRSMVSRSESYLFDVAAFYNKWETDLADAQRDTGSIPDVAPSYWTLYNDDVTWPSTFLFVPAMLYDQYGDRRAITRNYSAMKKWADYMSRFLKDDLMPKDTYGDWCVPPEDPKLIHSQDPARKTNGTLIASAYYAHLLRLLASYARISDKADDAQQYEALSGRIRAAIVKRYYNEAKAIYDNGSQTSSILPLALDIAPESQRKALFDGLVHKIEDESRSHIGVGLVGAQWLMRTLSDNGRPDLAYTIATQPDYPGWGYMIKKGATTIWELWNGDTADPAMNSGNHVMQVGDLGIWLYAYLAGIRSDPEQPGFRRVIIKPTVTGDLTYVRASHESPYGKIESNWTRQGNSLRLDVTVPPNSTALVYVPASAEAQVTESNRDASTAPSVKFLRREPGAAVYEVGSGYYRFASKM